MGRCWLLLAAGGVGPGFWRLLGLQTRLQLCRCLERVPRRRYLMLEFPSLAVAHPPQHIAEIGCGCGSGALRCWLRRAEARARGLRLSIRPEPHRVALCSLQRCSRCSRPTPPAASPAATSAPQRCTCSAVPGSRLGCSRIHTLVLDAAANGSAHSECDGSSGSPLAGLHADSLLLVFTLSALPPEAHGAALAHAFAALRPGGLLLFRCGPAGLGAGGCFFRSHPGGSVLNLHSASLLWSS